LLLIDFKIELNFELVAYFKHLAPTTPLKDFTCYL
jgi:hypothetical protein